MESFYLHFNTDLCETRGNRYEYVIYLPEYLEGGPEYEIALVNCSYAHSKEVRYFCTDLIEPQYLHDTKVRILKVIPPTTKNYRNMFTPTYVQMGRQTAKFNSFSISVVTPELSRVIVKADICGTLHVRKRAIRN